MFCFGCMLSSLLAWVSLDLIGVGRWFGRVFGVVSDSLVCQVGGVGLQWWIVLGFVGVYRFGVCLVCCLVTFVGRWLLCVGLVVAVGVRWMLYLVRFDVWVLGWCLRVGFTVYGCYVWADLVVVVFVILVCLLGVLLFAAAVCGFLCMIGWF